MEGMKLIVSIVERGRGAALQKLYGRNQVFLHTQCPGRGTATSEIMDILGLGSSEKDVVLSYAAASAADGLLELLDSDLRGSADTSGIVFSLPLAALNNLTAAAIDYKTQQARRGAGGENAMEPTKANSLILITCARGRADDVIATAKEQGARGGTVVKARWSGVEDLESSYGLDLSAERDILAIVVTADKRNAIMEAVNQRHGLRSEEQAMQCALPIDRMVRLG